MTEPTQKRLPGVLSGQRLVVITDAPFENLFEDGRRTPLEVVRHGIRGTQNVNNEKESEVSNIQMTETARTDVEAIGFAAGFAIRFLPLERSLFACAGEGSDIYRENHRAFVDRACTSEGLREVARRYARNILNGRWLWRNHVVAQSISVHVAIGSEEMEVDALSIPRDTFGDYRDEEDRLGRVIHDSLAGGAPQTIEVEAHIRFGFKGAVEVFPSQNYVEGKPKGFARPLYKVGHPEAVQRHNSLVDYADIRKMGQAALRDQKVNNAIRTIDTWYPAYAERHRPIPVEPSGASLDAMEFFRRNGRDNRHSAFDLMRRLGQIDPDEPDGMFLIATLVRGGVFGEGEDEAEKEKKKEKKNAA